MQFFLLSPLLMLCLRPAAQKGLAGRLAKACGLVIAAVTVYRALIALDFRLPVPVFGPLENPEALELMTRTLQVSITSSMSAAPGALEEGMLRTSLSCDQCLKRDGGCLARGATVHGGSMTI